MDHLLIVSIGSIDRGLMCLKFPQAGFEFGIDGPICIIVVEKSPNKLDGYGEVRA
jgi:hypothetical protein